MAHILARLKRVSVTVLRARLTLDAAKHAVQGLHLQHFRQNADDPTEVMFLFHTDDLQEEKRFFEEARALTFDRNLASHSPHWAYSEES